MTDMQRLSEVRYMAGNIRERCRTMGAEQYSTLYDMIQADVNAERKSFRNGFIQRQYHVSKPAQIDYRLVGIVSQAFALMVEPENIYKELRLCSKYLPIAIHMVAEHGERMVNHDGYMGPLDLDRLHAAADLMDFSDISSYPERS